MKHIFYLIAALLMSNFFTPAHAQQRAMTLDECMAYAVENSPRVKKQERTADNYRQSRNEALASLFPSLEGRVGGQASFGRVAGMDNIAVDNTTMYLNSYSASISMPIFAGLSAINSYKAARTAMQMGRHELDLARDEVALETMQAYYDAVYYTHTAALAAEKLEATRADLHMTLRQEELGMKSRADALELEAQAAYDEFLLTQQENLRDMALIVLKERMNYPSGSELLIAEDVPPVPGAVPHPLGETLARTLDSHPRMMAAELSLRQTELSAKAVKGRLLPSLYFSGGYSNNYYHTSGADNYSFSKQWELNRNFYAGVSLSIPIFNGLSRRTAANRARNSVRIAEQDRLMAERSLQSEVEQAYRQLQGLEKEYAQASKKVATAELAHRAVVRRYEHGAVSALELQTSANRLLEAKAQQLNAHLQYIVKHRLVGYYNGEPLIK